MTTVKKLIGERKKVAPRFGAALAFLFFLFSFSFSSPSYASGEEEAFWEACGGATPCIVSDMQALKLKYQEIAQTMEQFAASIATILNQISSFLGIKKIVDFFLGEEIPRSVGEGIAVRLASDKVRAESNKRIQNAKNDATYSAALMDPQLQIEADTTLPPAVEQFLCNKITACQTPPVMERFAAMVSRMIVEGISLQYREKGSDGDGPQYAADVWRSRYGGNPAGVMFGNPIEGTSEGYRAETTSPLTSTADRDISSSILDWDTVLQLPPLKEEVIETSAGAIKVSVPDVTAGSTARKDMAEKNNWMAAVEHCARLAGPRPSPPYGMDMASPEGVVKRAQWSHCEALQNTFIKICADRIGMLSRPDCGSGEYDAICEASLHGCNAARTANLDLPQSMRNCAAGASLYQAEALCNAMCGSERQAEARILGGDKVGQMIADMTLCRVSKNIWERKKALLDRTFVEATAALQNLSSCWERARYR